MSPFSRPAAATAAEKALRRVDKCIARLLSVRDAPPGTEVALLEEDLVWICRESRRIFLEQPMLLEVNAPISVCGDTHGQYHDLLKVFAMGGFPPAANYLFLGDYVDRASQSIETIALLLCFKVRHPGLVFLLRGNHECSALNRIYGFYDECKRRYSIKLWKVFGDCFNCMPVAAVIGDRVLCMHGGLSPELEGLDQIAAIRRPTEVPEDGLLCDLLWSDPDRDVLGWGYNARGVSYTFGADVVAEFLRRHDLDLVCRAHQVVEDGYEFAFGRRVVTVFSAPNYCGEFDNAGGMMVVDREMRCSFRVLRPAFRADRTTPPSPGQIARRSSDDDEDLSDDDDSSDVVFDPASVQALLREDTPHPGTPAALSPGPGAGAIVIDATFSP